ncbi:MAG: hypothetical protein ACOY93_05915 [Bacillota bacterium]
MKRPGLPLLLTLVLCLLLPGPALANSGPPHQEGGQSGLLPGRSGTIHVLSEQLRIAISSDLAEAEVSATYRMANRGPESRLPVLFVIQEHLPAGSRENRPRIRWEGQELPVTERLLSLLPEADQQRVFEAWGGEREVIDPVSGERYLLHRYGGTSANPWAGLRLFEFELPLGEGSEGSLEVTYTQPGGYDRSRYLHRIYHYHYLLKPARGWASFGPLEVVIGAPERPFFAATLPLRYEDGAYRATLPGLPEENLTFSFMSREGILFSQLQPAPYYWIAAGLLGLWALLLGIGVGRLLAPLQGRRAAGFLALLAGLLAGGVANFAVMLAIFDRFPWLTLYGYAGTPPIGMVQWALSTPLTGWVAMIAAARFRRRRPAGFLQP